MGKELVTGEPTTRTRRASLLRRTVDVGNPHELCFAVRGEEGAAARRFAQSRTELQVLDASQQLEALKTALDALAHHQEDRSTLELFQKTAAGLERSLADSESRHLSRVCHFLQGEAQHILARGWPPTGEDVDRLAEGLDIASYLLD